MIKRRHAENGAMIKKSPYDSKIRINSVRLLDVNNNEITELNAGEPLIIECNFTVTERVREGIINFGLNHDSAEISFQCYSTQINGGKFYDFVEGTHKFRVIIPKLNLKIGFYNIGVSIAEKMELAYHAWNNDKNLLVKTGHPEFGLYDLQFHFELDKNVISLDTCNDHEISKENMETH